ncbi:MAG: hypothetical protein P1P82_09110 [Bacteroidales bacterium]|nr:hypothetical protein [Bacteroidales bacterium]MDT8430604.1 hypothetical protein [Bacteroidales bacterium]
MIYRIYLDSGNSGTKRTGDKKNLSEKCAFYCCGYFVFFCPGCLRENVAPAFTPGATGKLFIIGGGEIIRVLLTV